MEDYNDDSYSDEYSEYDKEESLNILADLIAERKYNLAERKFINKIKQGYYGTANEVEKLHTIPEAFFIEYKKYNDEEEIYQILLDTELIGNDGYIFNDCGDRAKTSDIFNKTIDPDLCFDMTARFMRKHFGDDVAKKYVGNFNNQKEIVLEAFAHYFLQRDKEPNYADIKEITSSKLFNDVLLSVKDTDFSGVIIKTNEEAKEDRKFGSPFNTAITKITDKELNRKTYAATVGTLADIKHFLTSDKYIKQIKERMEFIPQIKYLRWEKEFQKEEQEQEETNKRKNKLKI